MHNQFSFENQDIYTFKMSSIVLKKQAIPTENCEFERLSLLDRKRGSSVR